MISITVKAHKTVPWGSEVTVPACGLSRSLVSVMEGSDPDLWVGEGQAGWGRVGCGRADSYSASP